MKVGQKTIVRWIAKRAAKRSKGAAVQASQLRELDAEQQRQVGGGTGTGTSSPRLGW
jgi:hypothetical protein